MGQPSTIDDLDRELLVHLNTDARYSFRELAKIIGASPTTIKTRIAQLEADRVIQGYIPVLDDEKLGWDLWAVIGIWIAKGKLREVEDRLAQDDHAYAIYDVTGDTDAILIGRFKDRRDLDKFVKHVLQDPMVQRTNTQVILNRVKEERRVPVEPPSRSRKAKRGSFDAARAAV
jgi:Lrp/AsnC family transcriptional regulator, regulator for asnA, asnC and gidA